MGVLDECFEDLRKDCDRISINIRLDCRKGADGRIESKTESVEKRLETP